VASNFQQVCQNLVDWIKKAELKREQLISINAAETSTENADAVLIVTYRTIQEPSMTTLDGIKYELIKNIVDWDEQYH
jgi:ABC-type taurine transport system substrate-binding protein